jgi:hypothetical protein
MREPVEPVKPGQEVEAALTWRDDNGALRPGARVEATDGVLGTVTQRRAGANGEGEGGFLGVKTDSGEIFVPERLIRETRGETVFLSLPAADARAQSRE